MILAELVARGQAHKWSPDQHTQARDSDQEDRSSVCASVPELQPRRTAPRAFAGSR